MVSVSMWAVLIEEGVIADYSTFEQAERSGFDPAALVSEDYERCQSACLTAPEHTFRMLQAHFRGHRLFTGISPGTLNRV
jgi:hypothetical protein